MTLLNALHQPSAALRRALPALIAAAAAIALIALGLLVAPTAHAETSSKGGDGQKLTVTQTEDLNPEGTEVTVTGTGFNENKGVYVALCVNNGQGNRPTPCIGGVDMEGAGGASAWISSNPPTYGKDLATPFSQGGRFEVELTLKASDDTTDCRKESDAPNGCVLATYADHTRLEDRSADVLIPITFSESGAQTEPTETQTEPATPTETTNAPESAAPTSAQPTSDATTEQATTGTPPQFWIWIGLAAAALLGALTVIRTRMRKNKQDTPDA